MLIMDLNISKNFILNVHAQGYHLPVSSRHSNSVHQTAFIIVGNILICLSQVPS